MFDDPSIKNAGAIPPNLPIGEPEDMFADADTDTAAAAHLSVLPSPPSSPSPQEVVPPTPSALEAGILRPKGVTEALGEMPPRTTQLPRPPMPAVVHEQMPPPAPREDEGDVYHLKEPIGRKSIITWIVILVLIVILGGGSAWLYFTFVRTGSVDEPFTPPTTQTQEQEEQNTLTPAPAPQAGEEQPPIDDANVLFGTEVLDTDNDSLDDVRERDIGTDSLNWDSDADELGDGDEVIIWKTNPMNPDSDADGYKDGAEVKNGYNPAGAGKLFEPPPEIGDKS